MSIIEIENLAKSYRVYQKKEGLIAAVTGLFNRQYKHIEAVSGVNLTVEPVQFGTGLPVFSTQQESDPVKIFLDLGFEISTDRLLN